MGLVEAARFDTRIEADLPRLLPESADVDAVLFDADMKSFGWGPMIPARVMGLEEDLALALEVLAEDA